MLLVLRVILSVLCVAAVLTGLALQAFAEAAGSRAAPPTSPLRRRLRSPRAWYVTAAVLFAAVVALTILWPADGA